jgi:putative ABC transport system ATP-binding protein
VSAPAFCTDVILEYDSGESRVRALDGVTVRVEAGDRLALRGRSGSGKTTLLQVLGGLLEPDQGEVGREGRVAYVFQGSNLLPTFTAYENVAFAARSAEAESSDPLFLLQLVGLAAKAEHLPDELSGGRPVSSTPTPAAAFST